MKETKTILEMPEGWNIVKGASTAPNGFVWVSNGKSFFGGERERALLKIKSYETSLS